MVVCRFGFLFNNVLIGELVFFLVFFCVLDEFFDVEFVLFVFFVLLFVFLFFVFFDIELIC